MSVSIQCWRTTDHHVTYHGKGDSAVGHEVVVKAWQVGTTAVLEFNGCVDVDAERMAAFNMVQDLLALLLQQLLLRSHVLDDGRRILDGGQGGDVVQRRGARQCARRRIGEKGGIRVAQAHCAGDVCGILRGWLWMRVWRWGGGGMLSWYSGRDVR